MPPRASSRQPSRAASSKPVSKAKAAPKEEKKPVSKQAAKDKKPVSKAKATKKEEPEAEDELEEEEKAAEPVANGKKRNGDDAELASSPVKKPAPVKRRRIAKRVNELATPVPNPSHVFVWGTGDMGQFGLGPDNTEEKSRPILHKWFEEQIEDGELGPAPEQGGIETIACGGMHTLAVDQKGQVRSWGINDNAALGRNTAFNPDPENPGGYLPADEFEAWPFVVKDLVEQDFRAVKVAAGDSVSVAVSDKGDLRAWGSFRSNDGILGFDGVPGHKPFQFTPIELPKLAKVEIVDVACGADHVLALSSEGHVYSWGNGQQSQLGRRVMERRRLNGLEPERLGLRNIVHVAAGQYHSFAIDKDGVVYGWGLNTFHQIGLNGRDEDEEMIMRPQIVEGLKPSNHNGAKVVQISGGEHHSLFLFDNGELWGCGRCDANELGLASDHPAQEGLKERREQLEADKVQKVKDAEAKVASLKSSNADSETIEEAENSLLEAKAGVGLPPDEFVPEPVRIPFPPIPEQYEVVPEMPAYTSMASNPIAAIAAGTRHNIAISRSGHTYAWGLGNQAQLGLGPDEESASVPSLVRSKQLRPYDATYPSAGGQHCVLLATKRQ